VASIRATCPTCGDVDLTIEQVKVLVCSSTNAGSYCFRCPTCTLAVSKPADNEVVDLLLGAGVPLALWNLPAELAEEKTGPAITYDDVLEFHFQLQDDSWLASVVEAVPPASA
jgi:hypothetical protein